MSAWSVWTLSGTYTPTCPPVISLVSAANTRYDVPGTGRNQLERVSKTRVNLTDARQAKPEELNSAEISLEFDHPWPPRGVGRKGMIR